MYYEEEANKIVKSSNNNAIWLPSASKIQNEIFLIYSIKRNEKREKEKKKKRIYTQECCSNLKILSNTRSLLERTYIHPLINITHSVNSGTSGSAIQ